MLFIEYGEVFLNGLSMTLYVCFVGILLGMMLGAIVCLLKFTRFKTIDFIMTFYIDFFRGTPFLIQVYILYYVGPIVGLDLSAIAVGIIGLALYGGAYFAEIYRGGVLAVPKGQIEAAKA